VDDILRAHFAGIVHLYVHVEVQVNVEVQLRQ
jgi:hypothetical protein